MIILFVNDCSSDTGSSLFDRYAAASNPFGEDSDEEENEDVVMDTSGVGFVTLSSCDSFF